jgi:hypothetical protein
MAGRGGGDEVEGGGRGLHSLTSQLNLSALCGIGGALRGCVAHVKGVFRVCREFSCVKTRLKLS